jgi:predicted alpha/beta-hydrolase family hydrolase
MSKPTGRSALKRWLKSSPISAAALLLTFMFSPAWGSDLAKEKRWADQIVDELFDGEAVWLEAGGSRFLGIYTEADAKAQGSIIVLHGIGVHPDWPQVINPLRVGLAEQGWNTLSVQLPILSNEAEAEEYLPLFSEVPPRKDAALHYLQQADSGPVFIVSHSMGSSMALHYMAGNTDGAIAGLILIGSSAGGTEGLDEPAKGLNGLDLPILDLYGQFDLNTVLSGGGKRAEVALASGNEDFSQVQTPGADHFYDGYEEQLLATVSQWLEARR